MLCISRDIPCQTKQTKQLTSQQLEMSIQPIETVVVHPLVLLSVVDHYNRIDKVSSQKRVVGILLGSRRKGNNCHVFTCHVFTCHVLT